MDCKGRPDKSNAGHVFVSLVRRDEAIGQTVIDTSWGFNPNKQGIMALISTPGGLDPNCMGDLGSTDFMVEVDQATYWYAFRLTEKWKAKTYGIFANVNCVDFVKDMLDLVIPQLKMPQELKLAYLYPGTATGSHLVEQWYKLPKPFLHRVRLLNSTRDKTARQSLANGGVHTPSQPTQVTGTWGTEDFQAFIQKFSKDPAFQRSRVKFPLTWEEHPEDKTVIHKETQTTWKHYDILKPSSEDYKVTVGVPTTDKPNEASVGETCRGGGCGYGAGLTFKRIGGVWYCVSRYFFSN